jgi:CheY-like chemotaxis protein
MRHATHSLVNELAAIRLQAEAIHRSGPNVVVAERASGVAGAASRAAGALRELQALAAEPGPPVRVDVRQLLQELEPLLHAMAGARATVQLRLPADPVETAVVVAALRRQVVGRIAELLESGERVAITVALDGAEVRVGAGPYPQEVSGASAIPAVGEILVVEDDDHMRDLLLRVLELAGRQARAVADAESALADDGLRRSQVRLVLADLHLPGRSGEELVDALRAVAPGTDVVLMSGDVRDSAGRATVLRKPFGMNELLAVLDARLGPVESTL